MKRYKVDLSPRAFRQLAGIEQWIEQEGGSTIARRYRKAIVNHCRLLTRFPSRGRPRDDLRPGLRTLVFRGSVTIVYTIDADEVQIVAIIGRGRGVEHALQD